MVTMYTSQIHLPSYHHTQYKKFHSKKGSTLFSTARHEGKCIKIERRRLPIMLYMDSFKRFYYFFFLFILFSCFPFFKKGISPEKNI